MILSSTNLKDIYVPDGATREWPITLTAGSVTVRGWWI